ncbi:MAG: DUF4249 family protein, partial [Bacteroidota bacterium]
MRKIFTYTIILLSFAACEKKTDWDLQSERSNLVVVDGMITDEKKAHAIKLTFPVENLNDVPQPVTGAGVTIYDPDSVYNTLTEQPANSGIYVTSSDFFAKPVTQYTLLITHNGNVYTAKAHLLPGINFTQLQFVQNTENDMYHLTYIASPFNAKDYAMWEVLLDWSNVQGYQQMDPDSCKARLLYYTLPTIDVGQVFSPVIEKISFPANTLITERRYSITAEHAQYIRAMLSETNWSGGLFDSAHSNVPTNMSEGA